MKNKIGSLGFGILILGLNMSAYPQEKLEPQSSATQDTNQDAKPTRIRVRGKDMESKLIKKANPVYPVDALSKGITGTVLLQAIIAEDGKIEQLAYISGPTLLIHSALNAVRQWRYKPTLLNGEPVEVETTVSIAYTLK